MNGGPSPPLPSAFFASRKGVCVYVTVHGLNVRVCFASADAKGHAESEAPPRAAATPVDLATRVFREHRGTLAPLFEAIESPSQVEN